jgi:hypothetical protein
VLEVGVRPVKKEKPRCKNCGDETTFPKTVDAERETKGWCTACFGTWKKNWRDRSGGGVWLDSRDATTRNPYASRPSHPGNDS